MIQEGIDDAQKVDMKMTDGHILHHDHLNPEETVS